MSEVSDHNSTDLLTEYGMATTAYLLMAMSIDSLEHRNRQLEAENARLRKRVGELCDDQCDEHDRRRYLDRIRDHWKYLGRMRELGVEVVG